MTKKMLINATTDEEIRVAIVENGILQEIGVERVFTEQVQGNIYKGVVTRVDASLGAAFVDYGGPKNGFLPAGEVHPRLYKGKEKGKKGNEGSTSIQQMLEKNQQILIQVDQEPRGEKGALLTTYISLPGRYLVLMPYRARNGVSRKIEDEEERNRLKRIADEINSSEEMGIIVRTAGQNRNKSELKRELRSLRRLWDSICKTAKKATPPILLYQESNLVIRTIRDYMPPDIKEIIVDSPGLLEEVKGFLKATLPRCEKLVKLHREKVPLFTKYQVEEQVESMFEPKVRLKSGGNIVIETTEALVAIDVNTAQTSIREDPETTAFRTNLEAAQEIARQLRLRDLGGLIVIDFIDMQDKKHRTDVERCLREAFKGDKAKVRISRISSFGLLEMSRQRIRPSLESNIYDKCPYCLGRGTVKSSHVQALEVYRKIQAKVVKGGLRRVEGELPFQTAHYLLNDMRSELLALEADLGIRIEVRPLQGHHPQKGILRFIFQGKEDSDEVVVI